MGWERQNKGKITTARTCGVPKKQEPYSMSLMLNKPRLDNLAGDIWKSAERLRGKFKAYEYQNVVLPIIVIRRLECVLINAPPGDLAAGERGLASLPGREADFAASIEQEISQ